MGGRPTCALFVCGSNADWTLSRDPHRRLGLLRLLHEDVGEMRRLRPGQWAMERTVVHEDRGLELALPKQISSVHEAFWVWVVLINLGLGLGLIRFVIN